MRTSLLTLCCLVLTLHYGYALKCYRCSEQYTGDTNRVANDNKECLEEYTCDDGNLKANESYDTCYTRVSYNGDTDKFKINKGCFGTYSAHSNEDCKAQVKEVGINYYCKSDVHTWQCFSCCQGDLCNEDAEGPTSGDTIVMANMGTLMIAVLMIVVFHPH
ncbi:uncharacterized protein LOC144440370 [Glandiceps talaboti]